MSKSYFDIAIGVVGLAASLLGIGYAIGQRKKLKDVSEKIDRSVSELSSNINIDISEEVVNRAVTKAIERETSLAASRATVNVANAIESDMLSYNLVFNKLIALVLIGAGAFAVWMEGDGTFLMFALLIDRKSVV